MYLFNINQQIIKPYTKSASIFLFESINETATELFSLYNAGVQRRLRNISPTAIYMNCRCHKLALCLVHLLKDAKFRVLVEVDSILLGLWKLFHFSPRKFGIFSHVQEAYGKAPLHLIKAATTR